MLLPHACGACGSPGPSPCPACHAALRPPGAVPPVPGVDHVVALLAYEGPARALVAGMKYRNRRGALPWLADGMAMLVGARPDLVTWAPTTASRRRARGFDQAELLARAVARRLGVPARATLRRAPGPPQTGRDRLARLAGPAFVPLRGRVRPAQGVLVVDDVVTTGATCAAAARALRSAGAGSVGALAAAHTPPGRR